MRAAFAFGKTGLSIDLPDCFAYEQLDAQWPSEVPDEMASIQSALVKPAHGPALYELAKGRRSAAISVCDITRPVPNRITLPPVLETLERAGIPREEIVILIATGLHRAATEAEVIEIVGEAVAASYRVESHHARERDEHIRIGTTRSGTPVWIDRRFINADLRLTLGFIEPHLMAGFSGGRKLVAPGLAHEETIKTIHSPRFMRDRRAVEGSIRENPLNEELWEISGMARHDFVLDVALTKGRRIAGVFAGTPRRAHEAGIAFVRESLTAKLSAPADAAITCAAGYPLDLTFYQTIKGVTAAANVVRPGGIVVTAGECAEGAGAAEFAHMLKSAAGPGEFLQSLDDVPVKIDQWQLEKLALVAREKEVWFYTPGLPEEFHGNLWGRALREPGQIAEGLLEKLPRGARVAIIPEGPYVLGEIG